MTATCERPDDLSRARLPGARAAVDDPAPRADGRRGAALVLAAIVLVAANLRLAVSATGALLTSLSGSLHLGSAVTSFLPSIWTVAFAFGGLAGSPLARRFGVDRVITGSLAALIAGSVLRGFSSEAALLAGSLLAGLGIALANVLLPAVSRSYFPTRIGLVTGLYGTALTGGAAVSALVAVPAANAFGGPSLGLAVWAAPAFVALLAWYGARGLRASRASRVSQRSAGDISAHARAHAHVPLRALTHSKLVWAMTALFALQSACAYVVMGYLPTIFEDAGMTAAHAGALLSATFFLGIPVSFAVPLLGARMRDQRVLILALSAAFFAGFVGLALAPAALAWLWVALIAIGMSVFQLVLALIGLRGGTPAGTTALSTFAQSLGYFGAAGAPFAAGMLHDAMGSWRVPLLAMAVLVVGQGAVGLYVASGRRGTLDAELRRDGERTDSVRARLELEG
ncbi:MAG: MFS transporter [Actinocrinis sp.]